MSGRCERRKVVSAANGAPCTLFTLEQADAALLSELGNHLFIVTLSAKITMPWACRNVVDVLGQLDGFGAFISRQAIPTDVIVPGAGHHTNRAAVAPAGFKRNS